MNNRNKVGPKIDPWGTPDNVWENSDSPWSLLIAYKWVLRFLRHESRNEEKYGIAENDSTPTGFEPRTSWSKIKCSNH